MIQLLAVVLSGLFLLPSTVLASGGFTWIGAAQDVIHTHIPEHILTFTLVGVIIAAWFAWLAVIGDILCYICPLR